MQKEKKPTLIDRYFHNCLSKIDKTQHNRMIILFIRIQVLSFSIFICKLTNSHPQQTHQDIFYLFLKIALAYNILNILQVFRFYSSIRNNSKKLTDIARQLNHCLLFEQIQHIDNAAGKYSKIQTDAITGLSYSQSHYSFQFVELIDYFPQGRQQIQNQGQKNINRLIQASLLGYKFVDWLLNSVSIGLLGFGLAIIFSQDIDQSQILLLKLFLAAEILFKLKLYAILFIILLAPAILVGYLMFICCHQPTSIQLPQTVTFTAGLQSKCSQCAICCQTYSLNQDIIILKCSQMHIFHPSCIASWSRIKHNCPICRCQI